MEEVLNEWIPNVMNKLPALYESIYETLVMIGWSGSISFIIGLFLGIIVTVTKPGNILENSIIYHVLDKAVNFFRSIPFIILLATLVPLTRMIMDVCHFLQDRLKLH